MSRRRFIPSFLSSIAAAICFALGFPAEAANLRANPSVSLEASWDSNVFNSANNEESDFVFRGTPRLTLSLEMPAAVVNLTGALEFEKYADHQELEANPVTKLLELGAAGPVLLGPRFSVLPVARYTETRDATRRIFLVQEPIEGLPPTEVVVAQRTEDRDYAASLQMTYRATPNVDLSLTGAGTKREYLESPPGLFDYRTLSGGAAVSYRSDPLRTVGVFVNASKTFYDERPDAEVYTGGFSLSQRLSERHTLSARVGASLLREQATVDGEVNNEWSPFGTLALTYLSPRAETSFGVSYEVAGGGSLGRATKRANAFASLRYLLAARWSADLGGNYQWNRTVDGGADLDYSSASGRVGIRYDPARWIWFGLSGTMTRQWSQAATLADLSRESVALTVTLSEIFTLL